jgi:signal transduction histidine kinase
LINFNASLLKTDLSNKQKKIVHLIGQNSHRHARLVKKLLSYCWIEAGKMEPNKNTFSFCKLITDCVQLFEMNAHEKNINIIFRNNGINEGNVCADKDLINEVMINMIDNAIKFTPKNGGDISIEILDNINHYRVNVIDKGVGISKMAQKLVFESFYQGDKETFPGKVAGSGLGLAIVAHIIKIHNGKTYLDSDVGNGSQFGFSLPK